MLIPIEDLENHWTENQNLMVLLPILEYSYPSVLDKINTSQVLSREVLREVVEYSLSFPSRHWAMSAVTWMDNGFEINQSIYEKLVLISLIDVFRHQVCQSQRVSPVKVGIGLSEAQS